MNLPGFTADVSLNGGMAGYTSRNFANDAAAPLGNQVAPQFPIYGFGYYGNYCGLFHGHGTPVDAVDSVCERHDACYRDRVRNDCLCDRRLLDEMQDASDQSGLLGKAAAAAISRIFSVLPCRCNRRVCYPSGVRWCTRRVWRRTVRYPCGTHTTCRTMSVFAGRGGRC